MNRLPLEILELIAAFAVEPVYKLAHGLSGYNDGYTLGRDGLLYLCENPHPGICSILEANRSKLTPEMWRRLANHPAGAAFEFLKNHSEMVPTADWMMMKRLQDEYDMDAHMKWYSNESLSIYGLPDDLHQYTHPRMHYGWDPTILYDLITHTKIIQMIELEIVEIDEYEQHDLCIQYIYSHPDAIQYNVEASTERYKGILRILTTF